MTRAVQPIVSDPDIMGGTPVLRGTRVPFQTFIECLEGGESIESFLEGFPSVSRDQVVHAMETAKELVIEAAKNTTR